MTASLHLDGHGRAVIVGEAVVGGLLDLRIDGRFDGRALVLLAGEQRFEPLPHQLVGLPDSSELREASIPLQPRWLMEKKPVTGAYSAPAA